MAAFNNSQRGILITDEFIDVIRQLPKDEAGGLLFAVIDDIRGHEVNTAEFSPMVKMLYPIFLASVKRLRKSSDDHARAGATKKSNKADSDDDGRARRENRNTVSNVDKIIDSNAEENPTDGTDGTEPTDERNNNAVGIKSDSSLHPSISDVRQDDRLKRRNELFPIRG